MKTHVGYRSGRPVAVSRELLDWMEFFLADIVGSKSVTKGEIKVMGYLLRKHLQWDSDGKLPIRISGDDWVEEAGLSPGEIDKALAKCEEKGWIVIDRQAKPATLTLRFGVREGHPGT